MKQLSHEDVLRILPDRDINAHKGNFGRILLLCGSRGYTGAAALAATGALRCGAGLVYLGVPESIYAIEAVKLTEAMVFPLPEQDGILSSASLEKIESMLPNMDAVLIGPGLGCNDDISKIVTTVLRAYSGTVILDADGINALSGNINILRGRTGSTILTPHAGEFQRIGGVLTEDRVQSAVEFSRQTSAVVLLKGHNTVITDGIEVYVNSTGNPGMAVGGSGDVLSGMIAALVGQKIAPLEAAACGAWLHGAAGDLCAEEIGQYGMLPTDMFLRLPRLLK